MAHKSGGSMTVITEMMAQPRFGQMVRSSGGSMASGTGMMARPM
jgi:hypothetical protein